MCQVSKWTVVMVQVFWLFDNIRKQSSQIDVLKWTSSKHLFIFTCIYQNIYLYLASFTSDHIDKNKYVNEVFVSKALSPQKHSDFNQNFENIPVRVWQRFLKTQLWLWCCLVQVIAS